MQITEIRWKLDRPAAEGRGLRLPLGGGITVLDARGEEAGTLDFSSLQARWIDPPRGTFEDFWEFIFEDRGQLIALTADRSAPGRETFFRRAAAGRESEVLGDQLEAILLPAAGRSSKEEHELLSALLNRLAETQRVWFDPAEGRGKIALMEKELESLTRELKNLEEDLHDPVRLQRELTEGEERLVRLKSLEKQLAREQNQLKHLRTKSEYEKLLSLRQTLKETEERAGAFGARITDPGHNITVHELTELAALRNGSRELEEEVRGLTGELEEIRGERMRAEQERILAAHEARDLEDRERDRAEDFFLPPPSDLLSGSEREAAEGEAFPTKRQLVWLSLALLAAAAFMAGMFFPLAGYILGGIALTGVLLLLIPFFGRLLAKPRGDEDTADYFPDQTEDEGSRRRLAALRPELDRLTRLVLDLEEKEDRLAAAQSIAARRLKRKENELLLYIRTYAGPSQISEVDDILAALSRQRDTDSLYQETVADLLRQIADIKYGRSDEEMLREYDDACARLYGEEGEDLAGAYATLQLSYDPGRGQAVSRERLETAEEIDELSGQLREGLRRLERSREASVASASLEQRRAALSASLKEARSDYSKRASALGWLEEVLVLWPELDLPLWRETAGRFLARLTGRRPAAVPSTPPAKLRTPRLEGASPLKERETLFDPASFLAGPQELRYLAWRLAFAGQDAVRLPLILFDPCLPAGAVHRDYLLDALEEWVLEEGRQIVYLTGDPDFLEAAGARQMKVYNLL